MHHLVSSKRIPITTCPTWRLVDGLVKAFDENDDKALVGEEKSHLLTTLAANPEIAIYRYAKRFEKVLKSNNKEMQHRVHFEPAKAFRPMV